MSRSSSCCLSDHSSHSDLVSRDWHSFRSSCLGEDSGKSRSSQLLRPQDPCMQAPKTRSLAKTLQESALSNVTRYKNAPLSGFLQGEGQERSASHPAPEQSKEHQLGDRPVDISATAAGIKTASKGESFCSVGSELHGTGECAPCAFFFKPRGCTLGVLCKFCHLCPSGELKQRQKQKKVVLRQIRLGAAKMNASDPGQVGASQEPMQTGSEETL